MAFMTFPLDNIQYSAKDMEAFSCTRQSGVYAGGDFAVSCTGLDLNLTVSPGIAWINNEDYSGKVFRSDENVQLTLGLSDASLPRYDGVFIQFSKAANGTTIIARQGAAATNPAKPQPVQTALTYELCLAHILRPAGSAVLTAAQITDTRLDPALCGLMGDAVTQIDTEAIAAHVDAFVAEAESEYDAMLADSRADLMALVVELQTAINQIGNDDLTALYNRLLQEIPVISTDVAADAGSNAKAASPKAVADYVNQYADALNGKLDADATAAAAEKLETARAISVNLGSAGAASFDGTKNVALGVSGVLGLANGGLGASNAAGARASIQAQKQITFGTADLTPGGSTLAEGEVYFVYE